MFLEGQLSCRLKTQVGEDDTATNLKQKLSNGMANARASACDEGNFALQSIDRHSDLCSQTVSVRISILLNTTERHGQEEAKQTKMRDKKAKFDFIELFESTTISHSDLAGCRRLQGIRGRPEFMRTHA